MFIISLPPQVPQSFVDLGFQYSPLPFLPVVASTKGMMPIRYIKDIVLSGRGPGFVA